MTIKTGEDMLAADVLATAGVVIIPLRLNTVDALTTSDVDMEWVPEKLVGWKITDVAGLCSDPSSSGDVTLTVKKNGVAILTTQITISAGQTTSRTAPVQPVIDVTKNTLALGDRLSAECSGAGVGVTWCTVQAKAELVP